MAECPWERIFQHRAWVPWSRVYSQIQSKALHRFALDLLFITQVHNVFSSKTSKGEEQLSQLLRIWAQARSEAQMETRHRFLPSCITQRGVKLLHRKPFAPSGEHQTHSTHTAQGLSFPKADSKGESCSSDLRINHCTSESILENNWYMCADNSFGIPWPLFNKAICYTNSPDPAIDPACAGRQRPHGHSHQQPRIKIKQKSLFPVSPLQGASFLPFKFCHNKAYFSRHLPPLPFPILPFLQSSLTNTFILSLIQIILLLILV